MPATSLSELIPEDLPREDVVIDVPEQDRVSPATGEPLARIGEDALPPWRRRAATCIR